MPSLYLHTSRPLSVHPRLSNSLILSLRLIKQASALQAVVYVGSDATVSGMQLLDISWYKVMIWAHPAGRHHLQGSQASTLLDVSGQWHPPDLLVTKDVSGMQLQVRLCCTHKDAPWWQARSAGELDQYTARSGGVHSHSQQSGLPGRSQFCNGSHTQRRTLVAGTICRGARPVYSSIWWSALAFSAKWAARAPAAPSVRLRAEASSAGCLPRWSTLRAQARKMGVSISDWRPTALSTYMRRPVISHVIFDTWSAYPSMQRWSHAR